MVGLKNLIKNRPLLLPIVLVMILLLSLGGVSYLLNEESQVLKQKKQLLSEAIRDINQLDQIEKEQKEFQPKIDLASRTLPGSPEEVAFFVAQLEEIATSQNQGLEVKIEETTRPEGENFSSLGLNLRVIGSFQALKSMLNKLAQLPYHTQLSLLKIDSSGGLTTAQITIKLFMKKI